MKINIKLFGQLEYSVSRFRLFFKFDRYDIELTVPKIPSRIKSKEINKTTKRSLYTNIKIIIPLYFAYYQLIYHIQ